MNSDDLYEPQAGYNIENSLAISTNFVYPNDTPTDERLSNVDANAIIIRLTTLLFATHKPKLSLAAILYASGTDVGIYLNCENTLTDVAKALGESKQNFSAAIKHVKEEFNLGHTNTGKTSSCKATYSKTNYRKKAND